MKLGWANRATDSKMGLTWRWWWRWCNRFPFGYATPTIETGTVLRTGLRWVSLTCGSVTGSAMGLSLFFSFFLHFCLLLCSIWFLLLGFVLFFFFLFLFYLFFGTYMGSGLLTRLVSWERGAQLFFIIIFFLILLA